MELRHLRYFIAIAEELNFRRAAERLHLSRPALSKQLKELEDELGVELVERNTVSAQLSKAGRIFYKDAQAILDHVARASLRVRTPGGANERLLLGNPGPFAASFMPRILKRIRDRHPRLDVKLMNYDPPRQIPRLLAGDLQIAITLRRDIPASAPLEKALLVRSGLGVAVGAHHRLAKARVLSPKELEGERLLCIGDNARSPHRTDIRRVYEAVGKTQPRLVKVDGFEALLVMISGEQGLTILPLVFADSCPPSVRMIPLVKDCDAVIFELWALWRKNDPSALVRDFVTTLSLFNGRLGKPQTARNG